MYKPIFMIGTLLWLTSASGQATSPELEIRTIAEVETNVVEDGHAIVHLVPANRVAPGDLILYTVEVRNPSSADAIAPVVSLPIPEHVGYVADSAVGPGAEVTYSADGGATYERPENLKAPGPDGKIHLVKSIGYTHIRWKFRIALKSKSVAYARFRAVVK